MNKLYMKLLKGCIIIIMALISCNEKNNNDTNKNSGLPIEGTWQLISGTTIEKGDTTVSSYTDSVSFIKIINGTHFAFLKHNLNKGKDSLSGYDSGGGTYSLKDSSYTEHL